MARLTMRMVFSTISPPLLKGIRIAGWHQYEFGGSPLSLQEDPYVAADRQVSVLVGDDEFRRRYTIDDNSVEVNHAAGRGSNQHPLEDAGDRIILLKIYLYGYLNQVQSSRRLECPRRMTVKG
jgi:hypothetical protein